MNDNINIKYVYKKRNIGKIINYKEYRRIMYMYFKFLAKMLLDGHEIHLYKMGTLSIYGRKQKLKVEDGKIKGLSPNWKKTKELWKKDEEAKKNKILVFEYNEHSNGYRYRVKWKVDRVYLRHKFLYLFNLTRNNKRELAKKIKSGIEYKVK